MLNDDSKDTRKKKFMESLEEKKKEDKRRKALHAAREKQEQEKIREEQRTHAQQVKDNAKKVTIIQLFETIKEARKLAAELDPDTAATSTGCFS